MHWQDLVFAVGSIIFMVALIPSVRSRNKPALSSSLLTCGVLLAFVVCYATLGLTYSAVTTGGTAALWFTLAVQEIRK